MKGEIMAASNRETQLHNQTIRRSNGDAICGPMRTVISQYERDFYFVRPDDVANDGPYRHAFELYVTSHDELVFVVSFFDGGLPRYRHGQRFRKLDVLREFLERYDPCQYLSLAAGNRELRLALISEFESRRDDFLREAEARLAEHARA